MAGGTTGSSGSKSPIKILANIFISFIGAGVLGLPYAFKEAGVIEGLVVMTIVAAISVRAMMLIIDCKYRLIQKNQPMLNGSSSKAVLVDNISEDTDHLLEQEKPNNGSAVQVEEPIKPKAPGQELGYGDVGYYAIGPPGRILVELSIVISQIGFCCAYLIFISENLSAYVPSLSLVHWLCILLPPLSVFCLLRHLNSLAISSLFAQISNILAFGVVFWFDFEHFYSVDIHPKKMRLDGLPFFLCMAIYCYEGAGMILSLEASLAKEVRHNFKKYFVSTMVIVTTLYISFGVCGYLSFGPETDEIITLNLPKGKSLDFAIVVKSCLCLALFFTYPVMMFPVIKILETKLIPNPGEKVWQGNVLRFLMVLLTGAVVVAIPNFTNLMALVGATCCTMLALTLPGLFHLMIYKGSLTKWQICMDICLMVLGIVGAVIGTLDAFMRMKDAHLESTDLVLNPENYSNLSLIHNVTRTSNSINGTSGAATTNSFFNHTTDLIQNSMAEESSNIVNKDNGVNELLEALGFTSTTPVF